MSKFAIADVLPGHLNAMVKNLMRQSDIKDPNEAVRRFNAGEFVLVSRDPHALLKALGEPVTLSAVPKFVAKDAFTKTNGFAYLGDNFKNFILPVVEENIPETAIQVSELTRDARDLTIAAELKVHERGELALAHFSQAIQNRIPGIRTDGWANASYVIGADGETWAVSARLGGVGWGVFACRLGHRLGWLAGGRFLSR